MKTKKITTLTAISIVVANMIGTGVFTSVGFQLLGLSNGISILTLWLIGGIASLSGAVSYAEIGSRLPDSGGEYHFLRDIYHPSLGFIAGWTSIVVGFAAPIAAASIALASYSTSILTLFDITINAQHQLLYTKTVAIFAISFVTLIHLNSNTITSIFQNSFTVLKVILVLSFIVVGFAIGKPNNMSFAVSPTAINELFSEAFAVSLVYVMYSYSGWNASVYIINELDDPQKSIPRSLITGTAIVTIMYVLLNYVFIRYTNISLIRGQINVGSIVASNMLGSLGGVLVGIIITFGLVSTISSMTWVGSRVLEKIGNDYSILNFFSYKNKNSKPTVALLGQAFLAIFFILTSTFEETIKLAGFVLTLSSFLTVMGLFVLRVKDKNSDQNCYHAWGYPFTPILFLTITGWMMFYLVKSSSKVAIASLLILTTGYFLYLINNKFNIHNTTRIKKQNTQGK